MENSHDKKFEKKKRNAKIVRYTTIVSWALFVGLLVLNAFDITLKLPEGIALAFSILLTFMLFASTITYFANYFLFEKNMRMLEKLGVSIESCLWGEATATRLPQSHILCADHAMILEKKKLIIPYDSVEWIYKRVTKAAMGLVTTDVGIVIGTTTGAEYFISGAQKLDEEIMWIVGHYADKFSKDFVLGYGPEQLLKRSEIKKRKRAEKRK